MRSVLSHSSESGPKREEMQTECTPEEGGRKGHSEADRERWRGGLGENWGLKKFSNGRETMPCDSCGQVLLFWPVLWCHHFQINSFWYRLYSFICTFQYFSRVRSVCNSTLWFLPKSSAAGCLRLSLAAKHTTELHSELNEHDRQRKITVNSLFYPIYRKFGASLSPSQQFSWYFNWKMPKHKTNGSLAVVCLPGLHGICCR